MVEGEHGAAEGEHIDETLLAWGRRNYILCIYIIYIPPTEDLKP